jgi:hypothetical protein
MLTQSRNILVTRYACASSGVNKAFSARWPGNAPEAEPQTRSDGLSWRDNGDIGLDFRVSSENTLRLGTVMFNYR